MGVLAALERAGVVAPGVTPMGGVSGGAIAGAAFHSGMTPAQRLAATTALNTRCRPSNGCPGRLGAALGDELERFFPADSYKKAAPPVLSVFVSKVRGNATAVAVALPGALLLPASPLAIPGPYRDQRAFLDGLAASSYIPKWSAPPRFVVYNGEAVYDGGPAAGGRSCPPPPAAALGANGTAAGGKSYFCIKIECTVGTNAASRAAARHSARNGSGGGGGGGRRSRALLRDQPPVNAPALDGKLEPLTPAEWGSSTGGGPAAPEGSEGAPDIFIGMSDAPFVTLSREQIQMYTLLTVPPQHIRYLYEVGEQSAQAWMDKQPGLAEAAGVSGAARRAAAGKK